MDSLPDIFTSLSKYHTIRDHYEILKSITSDGAESDLTARKENPDVFATARRYLLVRNGIVVRDRLIDFIHSEGEFSENVKRVMYFLFMFRDARCRDVICNHVAAENGKWRAEVFRATHTSFFRGAGGHKAFTNLRRLLFDAGVLVESTLAINMGDVGAWLPIALDIAAQHLDDESRTRLIASPHGFLIRNKLNAIVNSTPQQLANVIIGGTYEEAPDLMPRIELKAGNRHFEPGTLKRWNRRRPAERTATRYDYSTDSVAFERAHHQHWLLESLTVKALAEAGVEATTNQLIDLVAGLETACVLFEMKSCNQTSMRSQFRRAISQLLEYRFLHKSALPEKVYLCVVLERKPRAGTEWMLAYAESLGIGVIWKEDTDEQLVCSKLAYSFLRRFRCHTQFRADK